MIDWKTARHEFLRVQFPRAEFEKLISDGYRGEKGHESHTAEHNKRHDLISFSFESEFKGWPVSWHTNYCPICSKPITRKGVIINNAENEVFQKYFVKGGEVVSEYNYMKPEEVFDGTIPDFSR